MNDPISYLYLTCHLHSRDCNDSHLQLVTVCFVIYQSNDFLTIYHVCSVPLTNSTGVGANMLLARLATREAKPNGQHALGLLSGPVQPTSDNAPSHDPHPHPSLHPNHQSADTEVKQFLEQLPLSQLPGVGYKLEKKLNEKNLLTCGDILSVRKETLKVHIPALSPSLISFI